MSLNRALWAFAIFVLIQSCSCVKTCRVSSDCPDASFCGDGHFCSFDCRVSTDCVDGCSCDPLGRCVSDAGRCAGPSSPPLAPCRLNTDCGQGSYCGADGGCKVDCIADRDCQHGCRCDIFEGHCNALDGGACTQGDDAGIVDAGVDGGMDGG